MNSLRGGADAAGTASGGLYRLSTTVASPILNCFCPGLTKLHQQPLSRNLTTILTTTTVEAKAPRVAIGQIPAPTVDSEGSVPVKCVHWAFIGEPNTKKHVYAEMISKLLQVPHISIASLVRQELSPRSFLYKEIAHAINRGKLVPESIIFGLLSKRLEGGCYRGENGFILDGIPRTRLQAEILDQLADINLVVNFKCSKGLKLSSGEADSNMSRFYKQQFELLEEYYKNQKKLIDYQVESVSRETWKGLLSVLHLQYLHAAQSSHVVDTGFRKP